MIFVDESIGIGKQKLLLILAIDLSEYSFEKAPRLEDVSVLDMSIASSWKSEKMQARLALLKQRGFEIKYGVSDGGASVVKSLADADIPRVADCTHVFGNLIKNRYSQSEHFHDFCRFCRRLTLQVMIGKNTVIRPPAQRAKGKYLNILPLVAWGQKMLLLLKNSAHRLTPEQAKKLAPLKDYQPLIEQISELCNVLKQLSAILKNQGLNQDSKQECYSVIEASNVPKEVQQDLGSYLENNSILQHKYDNLICCSDIIESTFGKYKRNLSLATKGHINDNCLFIANYSGQFSIEETQQAMEQIRIVDLAEWKATNTVTSLAKQQQELFKNTG
ncbi:MAG: hypothetical protein AAGJ82_02630 [Bacteroidota bacterium]